MKSAAATAKVSLEAFLSQRLQVLDVLDDLFGWIRENVACKKPFVIEKLARRKGAIIFYQSRNGLSWIAERADAAAMRQSGGIRWIGFI